MIFRRDEMTRVSINFVFALLMPFFKFERMLSDMRNGRKIAMIKIYYLVMDSRYNPLANIPDTSTRHLVMQMLAWMWCIVFSMWMGTIMVFGVSVIIHTILLAGLFITVGVFETARRHPGHFGGLGTDNGCDLE